MIKWAVLGLVIVVAAYAIYIALYLGSFREVKMSEGEAPAFVLLGKEHIGPYYKIVPVIEEVETWAKAHGIDCTQSFGLYLDDPKHSEEERLHSWGGCWIDEKQVPKEMPADFRVQVWSAPYFVKAVFEGSPGIGPMKVYPRADDLIAEKHYVRMPGTLEVYVVHPQNAMTTTYYFPVQKPAP